MTSDCKAHPFVTRCVCEARCGEVHGSACSDQNVLKPAGFIITCDAHREKNYEKHKERIVKALADLDNYRPATQVEVVPLTNKAATERKTELWCETCRCPMTVRHPRDRDVTKCPVCGDDAIIESIQTVMPR